MSNSFLKTLVIILCISQFSCSSNQQSSSDSAEDAVENTPTAVVENTQTDAVCIWDKVGLRDAPGTEGKWITSISIGESLSYLNMDSVIDDRTYVKVALNDGNQGWARQDFIVSDAQPGVIVKDADLYSRPDLLTKTDKKFSKMDIISGTESQDDWIKVKGKRAEGKWIDEGWIKGSNLSYDAVDIATAKFAKQALAKENSEDQIAALKEIIDNADLSNSKFIAGLVVKLTELSEANNTSENTSIDSIQ